MNVVIQKEVGRQAIETKSNLDMLDIEEKDTNQRGGRKGQASACESVRGGKL